MTFKTPAQRLSEVLNQLMMDFKIDGVGLGKQTGVPTTTINRLRNNDPNNNPTLTTLVPLANFFSITVSQLIGDEPLPFERLKELVHTEKKLMQLPLLTWEEALHPTAVGTDKNRQIIATEYAYSKNAFALLVEEDGWENLARGTALLIDPTLSVEHRDFIIVHKKSQKIPTLKQALYDEGQLYLKPVINGYQITLLTPEHTIIGVVAEYKKHLKNNF